MNVFELFATITLKTEGYAKGIGETQKQNEGLKSSMQGLGKITAEQKARLDVLENAYKKSSEAVSKLSKELQKVVAEEGAQSEKANKLSQELSKAEKEAAQAKTNFEQYKNSLKETSNESEALSQKTSKIGETLSKIAAVSAAALTAAGTAVSVLTKSAVSSFGEYEQLVGGVETLFGTSADVVTQYADNAYKTAGLSANQYMETVTSFSASLLQSLGGDTAKAAEYADVAVTDMSDNANKMGTDIGRIQDAYQGFAKQNYTIN